MDIIKFLTPGSEVQVFGEGAPVVIEPLLYTGVWFKLSWDHIKQKMGSTDIVKVRSVKVEPLRVVDVSDDTIGIIR